MGLRDRGRGAPRARGAGYRFAVLGILCAMGLTACSDGSGPATAGPPNRIISLVPAWTEVLVELGLESRLVARSRHCDHPPSVRRLPAVGDGFGVHMEALLARRPDLVVVFDADLGRRVERLGIRAVSVRADRLVEVWAAYEVIASAAGVPGRGRALAERVQSEIAAVARRYAAWPKRRVLFAVDGRSGHVVGPDNFVHELITALGGINVAADAARPWPVYSLEAALRRDPEVVLDSSGSYREEVGLDAERTFIAGLRATRVGGARAIVAVDQRLITLPGPRLGEAARQLGRAIHESR